MNFGFIGTGNIVSDVITGMNASKIRYKKIVISPRNEKNLNKRLQMDDFTGGDELDKLIKKQRKQKKNMKGEA